MALPETLRIGAHSFTVNYVKASSPMRTGDRYAEIDFDRNVISVCDEAALSRKHECILHEITHAGLKGIGLSEDDEERAAQAMGEFLARFIQDNPSFIRDVIKG